MGPFEYVRADDVAAAVALVSADAGADYLAGGTTQLDLMLKDDEPRSEAEGVVIPTGQSVRRYGARNASDL